MSHNIFKIVTKIILFSIIIWIIIISVFMDTCQYEGSTKDRLTNEEAYRLVVEGINNNTNKWIEQLLGKI